MSILADDDPKRLSKEAFLHLARLSSTAARCQVVDTDLSKGDQVLYMLEAPGGRT